MFIAYTFRLDTRGYIMCSLVSHALAALEQHYCGASLRQGVVALSYCEIKGSWARHMQSWLLSSWDK